MRCSRQTGAVLLLFTVGCAVPEAVVVPVPVPNQTLQDQRQRAMHRRGAGPSVSGIQAHVEQAVADRFGAAVAGEAAKAPSSIIAASYAGRFSSRGPLINALVRTSRGWRSRRDSGWINAPPDLGKEIDHLLKDTLFWQEPSFYPPMDCPDAGATMMVIRRQGQLRVTRQSCAPYGLTGKLAELVAGAGS